MTLKMSLLPVVPTSRDDEQTLYQMRVACGWDAHRVSSWMKDMDGKRLLWLILASPDDNNSSMAGGDPEAIAGMIALVLENENNTKNSFSFSKYGNAQISSLFIYPKYRGAGLGKAAFLAVEEHARKMGVHTMLLLTGTYENNNVPRYERLGYKQVDTIDNWWVDENLAAGIIPTIENSSATFMEKNLQDD